jgi:hypothetical protein
MSKPIFLIQIPHHYFLSHRDKMEEGLKDLKQQLHDYHVLMAGDSTITSAKFQCFNSNDATEMRIDEIQEMILNKITEI